MRFVMLFEQILQFATRVISITMAEEQSAKGAEKRTKIIVKE